MADRAILRGRRLVLQHHRGLGAKICAVVGPADQIHYLVALHRAGSWIDRIGADAGQIVDVDCGDATVDIDGHAPLDAVVPRVDIAGKALQPIGNEFYRAPHDLGDDRDRSLNGIDVHFDTVAATDVGANDAHIALRHAQVFGEDALHHVWRLRRVIDGKPARGAVKIGEDRPRLNRHAGVPAGVEGGLDDL